MIQFTIALFVTITSISAFAQSTSGNWWSADYIYDQFQYREPGSMKETGGMPGARMEVGASLAPQISLGVGGRYASGHLTYDGATTGGAPVITTTKDRHWHIQSKLYFMFDQWQLAAGWARRFLYNDLVISYRREQTYEYVPIGLTYYSGSFFFTYEHRHFLKGLNKSYMHDIDPNRKDIELKQKSGRGYAIEIGTILPSQSVKTKVSLAYESWNVNASEVKNDGVQDLVEPKNETQEFIFSIGLIF